MQITVITPENNIKREIELINDLFKNGLERLHLRKPDNSIEENRKYIKAIDSQYHSRVVIKNNFEMFNDFNLACIHLNGPSRRD